MFLKQMILIHKKYIIQFKKLANSIQLHFIKTHKNDK